MPARNLLLTGFLLLISTFASAQPATPDEASPTLNPALPTLFIAGDSTAAAKSGNPEQLGWGVPFADYFDPTRINIANRALGGRSSRTFITERHWERLLAEMKAGDIVLIQFGHNDAGGINEEPPGSTLPLRARGTIPSLGEESQEIDNVVTKQHEVVHTFGWYIRKMIADTRAKGATPLVLSLTVRNYWTDGRVERAFHNYREWDKEIAATAGIAFIDVTAVIADRYEKLGQAQVAGYFLPDKIHTTIAGADFNAACVVSGLRKVPKHPFDSYLSKRGSSVF
jgi:rhamnogalacturonan acetylesterase